MKDSGLLFASRPGKSNTYGPFTSVRAKGAAFCKTKFPLPVEAWLLFEVSSIKRPSLVDVRVIPKSSVDVPRFNVMAPRPSALTVYVPFVMARAFDGVPSALTSSIPPVMLPLPSAINTPTRANGTGKEDPFVKTSPFVTNAYWPFKLARLYFPAGVGGWTLAPPLPHAALQRAVATEMAIRRRFIAHPAGLPFDLESRWKLA